MLKAIIGKKIGMTQLFNEDGAIIPVTVLKAGPCTVVTKKTLENDGYGAVQLGFGEIEPYKVKKPLMGHFKKNNVNPIRILKEFRCSEAGSVNIGDSVNVSMFNGVKYVCVTGITKGKGFQGVVKRWGFSGGRDTHGSMFHRAPGSIGQSSFPSKVFRGLKMPGHLGNKSRTASNLKIIRIDSEQDLLFVKGAIPGANGNIVYIYGANEFGRKKI